MMMMMNRLLVRHETVGIEPPIQVEPGLISSRVSPHR